MVVTSTWPGEFMICVFLYEGSTQRLTESGFMEKPGIEPANPGLQDIGLSPTPHQEMTITIQWCIQSGFA